MRPAAAPGWAARVTAVTLQPGTAMRVASLSAARWAEALVSPAWRSSGMP